MSATARDTCFCHVTIRDGSWRETLWTRVFGKPEVPVVSPFPVAGFFTLDLKRVTPEQRVQVVPGHDCDRLSPSRTGGGFVTHELRPKEREEDR